ncbi:response regulator [Niveibacterium terrae]|uniref:response regulator n=1 Tax=Niveibacterium terrae TaxID=3373598 RepID=UPI003A8DBEE9
MNPLNSRTSQAHRSLNGMRALVADQHISVRTWLRELLTTLGIVSVSMAGSSGDLIRHLRNAASPFDIVLCDHQLDPRSDGLHLLEELRYQKILPLVTIFMIVTGERQYPRVVAAAEFAPDDYLIKPFSPSVLEDRLRVALQRKHHLHIAHALIDQGEHEKALSACDQAMAKSSHFLLDTLRLKAEVLVSLGRIEEASALYNSIAEKRMVPWARMGYAMTLHKQGRSEEAEQIAGTLNVEHPEFLSVYDFMARLKEEKGELAEAADYLERASNIASSTDRLRHLADVADAQGDHIRARGALQKVVERTRKSSMLQVSDYLKLLRATQADDASVEAEQIARDMQHDLRASTDNQTRMAIEVAGALVAHHARRDEEANRHVDTALALHAESGTGISSPLTLELANACAATGRQEDAGMLARQLTQHGEGRGATFDALLKRIGLPREELAGPESPTPAATEERGQAIEACVEAAEYVLMSLAESWDGELARQCRILLATAFNAAPRDRRVIEWHIRYNKLAAACGAEHHKAGSQPV